ncbi:MAG: hypothetical protein WCQ41_05900 [Bacillota bacterium]
MNKNVIGVEFDGNKIRIVECDGTFKKPRVIKAITSILSTDAAVGDRESFLAKFVKDELKKNNIKVKNAALGIFNNEVHLKYIQMPQLPKNKFVEALNMQSNELLDLDIENYYYEHRFLGHFMENNVIQNRYLVVAAKTTMVDEYISAFTSANLNLVDISTSVFYPFNLMPETNKIGSYVLIYLGSENSCVVIVKDGTPQYARRLKIRKMYEDAFSKYGLFYSETEDDFSDEIIDQLGEIILNETLGTVNYYHMFDEEYMPTEFIIVGAGALKGSLVSNIQSKVNLPAYSLDVMAKVELHHAFEHPERLIEYTSAIGAAVSAMGVNL